jgi:hypothetical protein
MGRVVIWAGIAGLVSSVVFSSALELDRGPFVLAHVTVVGVLYGVLRRRNHLDAWAGLRVRPVAAVVVGLIIGLLLAVSVRRLPPGFTPHGLSLVFALAWYGAVYGVADAMLLTVVPVIALRGAAAGLAGSLLVTALYHLGFDEFRGATLLQPLVGNGLITAGYLVTRNPVTALLAHVLMHAAAVLHGMDVTPQLPPHY